MAEIFACGEQVADAYQIIDVLGEGGMGQVYEALDIHLDRRVAIKVAWPGTEGPTLRSEARALAAFRHPSLPTVYGFGTHRGVDFIVMERVYGVSLAKLIELHDEAGDRFPFDEALRVMIDVGAGLSVVHQAGIAHRDVKPDNVMLTPERRVVLMDLGLHVPEVQSGAELRVIGSPAYMPPEALLGDVSHGAGQLVDIYAFGVLSFELLTGQLPRQADSLQQLVIAHNSPPKELRSLRPDLPPALSDLLRTMLAAAPEDRPGDMEEVLWALRSLAAAGTLRHAEGPKRVLVVDDDPDVARVMAFYAKQALGDVTIAVACDGEEALEQLRRHEPDVMLLDLQMPRMNGIEVCMYMRGTGLAPRCEVVAVSAGAQENDRQLLYQLGIKHVLLKGPDLRDQLTAALHEIRVAQ